MKINQANRAIIENIQKVIYSNSFNSLIPIDKLSKKKESTIIGIGGSHIYLSKLSGLRIKKSYREDIDFRER